MPHTWYTVEDYNNKLYIEATNPDLTLSAPILTVASGNYTATSLAVTLNNLLQNRFPNGNLPCVYNISVGTITISSTMNFRIITDGFATSLQSNIAGWYGKNNEEIGHPDYNNLRSINEVLRYSISSPNTSFETGFIDLLDFIFTLLIYVIILQLLVEVRIRLLKKCLLAVRSGILLWIVL